MGSTKGKPTIERLPILDEPVVVDVVGSGDGSTTHTGANSDINYLVAIGASAGGLRAIEDFFCAIPPDSGAAFVVIQHLSPTYKSLMKEVLSPKTVLNVHRVDEDTPLTANAIFLIPPRKNMVVDDRGMLRLSDQDLSEGHPFNSPIDVFFRSVAEHYKQRAISVVLSGTGRDGTRGIRAISEAGGVVLVQDRESAQFDGMPQSVINTGLSDHVLPPERLAEVCLNIIRSEPRNPHKEISPQEPGKQGHYEMIVDLLQRELDVDFSHYRTSTLARRIERRMLLGGHLSIEEYFKKLAVSPDERKALCTDMLINVTHFFRDTDAWDRLAEIALRPLITAKDPPNPLRIWVTACSTGEEAYTLAMLTEEIMTSVGASINYKIFATDIDKESLGIAAAGRYPGSIVNDLGRERVRKYFTKKGQGYQVSHRLRENVIFANHNITKDAPFTKMHLVTCRNVLIYMQQRLQQHVLAMLHYALYPKGTLFLGSSESLGPLEREFRALHPRWRIFSKKRDVRLPVSLRSGLDRPRDKGDAQAGRVFIGLQTEPPLSDVFGAMLSKRNAVCLILDEGARVMHVYGKPDLFMRVPHGRTTSEVGKMIARELALPLNTALHRAKLEEGTVSFGGLKVKDRGNGLNRDVELRVDYHTSRQHYPHFYAVIIQEGERAPLTKVADQYDPDSVASQRIAELEQELEQMRETLQATNEELETTNEEQQTSNQELIAANEELQSTNEELHSVNEELYTVNHEYQIKVQELTNLNNDIENLLSSTDVGTVFLDKEFRIWKFTQPATVAIPLDDKDIGCRFDHFAHNLEYNNLIEDIQTVLGGNGPVERDVKTRNGLCLLMRIHPYFTDHEGLHGAVMTFVDITDLKSLRRVNVELQQKNQEMEDFAYTISHDLKSPLVTIGGMIGLMKKRLSDVDDPIVKESIETVSDTVQEMRVSIDDLLELSRVGRAKHEPEPVQLGDVVRAVLDRLKNDVTARGVAVNVARNLPIVQADPKRMEQLFENLVINALKYACDPPDAVIEIGSETKDGSVRVFMKDNGPGISQKFHQKIFGLFQRLDTDKEGTGVGLAIVKRIMEVHQGRVWVESTLGRGATFWLEFSGQDEEGGLH